MTEELQTNFGSEHWRDMNFPGDQSSWQDEPEVSQLSSHFGDEGTELVLGAFSSVGVSTNIRELAEELAISNMPNIKAFHFGLAGKHRLWSDHIAMRDAVLRTAVPQPQDFNGDVELYINAAHEAIAGHVQEFIDNLDVEIDMKVDRYLRSVYRKELQDPGNFPELVAESLAKDTSLHLLVPIELKGKRIKPPTAIVLHSFRAPPEKVKNPIRRSQKPATQPPLSVPSALHESAEEKEELKRRRESIDLYEVKSGGHIMAHFQQPIVKETVRIIVRSYLKFGESLKSEFDSNKPLSRYILALAGVKIHSWWRKMEQGYFDPASAYAISGVAGEYDSHDKGKLGAYGNLVWYLIGTEEGNALRTMMRELTCQLFPLPKGGKHRVAYFQTDHDQFCHHGGEDGASQASTSTATSKQLPLTIPSNKAKWVG